MIRANLLPRPKDRIAIAGIDIDTEYLRQALVALFFVLVVAAIGIAIEMFRIARLGTAAAEQEVRIASEAPRRAELKAIALEVARYQSFAREAQTYRRSGADVAVTLAKIGNSVPSRVWLDSLAKQNDGYDVVGGALSVDTLGATIVSLGRALPEARATLVNMDAAQTNGGTIHFTARILGTAAPLGASGGPDITARSNALPGAGR